MNKMKTNGKTEHLITSMNHENDDFCGKKLSIITGKKGVSCYKKSSKMMNKSSQSNRAWKMGSLMKELPLSPHSVHSHSESPNHPRFSCRPSTVFYSPRNQDIKRSSSFTEENKKHLLSSMNMSSSYDDLSKVTEFLGVQSDAYEPSIDFNDCKLPDPAVVPDKRGIAAPPYDEFRVAIPVTEDEGDEHRSHRSHRHAKRYQELLEEAENRKQTEVDVLRQAAYTHLLRKLTKKEEAIDDWEYKCRKKAEDQLDNLEKKLEKKRAEAIQRVHKKLAETKLEAQKRKAKARRLAMKEMAKHCSQLN